MYKTASRRFNNDPLRTSFYDGRYKSSGPKQMTPKWLRQALSSKTFVKGNFSCQVKGGYRVYISGFECFCPFSEMYPKDLTGSEFTTFKKKPYKFLILKDKVTSLIVSRKKVAAIDGTNRARRSLKNGNSLEGKVVNIKDYGMFIDIGGINGLLHISEYPDNWQMVPPNGIKIGSKINVWVKGIQIKGISLCLSPQRCQIISKSN
jgi:small subunit ribosomal protein S1